MSKSTSNAQKRTDIDDAQSDDQSTTTTRETVTDGGTIPAYTDADDAASWAAGDTVFGICFENGTRDKDDAVDRGEDIMTDGGTSPKRHQIADKWHMWCADCGTKNHKNASECRRCGYGRDGQAFGVRNSQNVGKPEYTPDDEGGIDSGDGVETDGGVAVEASPAPDAQQTDDNHRTGKYGIPTATMNRARRHLGDNPVAQLDLQDRLFDAPITERALDQRDPMPDDPVGTYYDTRTGRLVDVGENKHGWLITRDHETHEPDVFDPGRVRPAINDRRLLPVSVSVTEVQG